MRTHVLGPALVAVGLLASLPSPTAAQDALDDRFSLDVRSLIRSTERVYVADAAGLTRSGRRLMTIEPKTAPSPTVHRLAIVGGLDGRTPGTRAAMDFLRWWTSAAAANARRTWQVAAMPCALPDGCAGQPTEASPPTPAFPPDKGFFDDAAAPEARYVWRWVAMEGPDLVVDVRDGPVLAWQHNALADGRVTGSTAAAADSLAGALGVGAPSGLAPVPALQVSGPPAEIVRALQGLVGAASASAHSPLRTAIDARAARDPLAIARVLVQRYPANPIMSYIPALSWSGALVLSQITGEAKWRDKAVGQMQPFLDGEKAAIAEPYLLTSLAGHQAFADWQRLGHNDEAGALAVKAADFVLPGGTPGPDAAAGDPVRFATKWTDDMFMASSVLARVAATTRDPKYSAAVAALLTGYAARLQQPSGLFIHAESGPYAWGRGNGFAAFGLIEALTHLPASWPARAQVLAIYRKQMRGLAERQAADGSWREVIDEPGSYREFTATAMIATAMARGLHLGWLDASFRPVVERAWRAVAVRIAEDGGLVDVCTGTGAGRDATRDYYLTRAAIFGPDDRGGAMGLTAALEMATRK